MLTAVDGQSITYDNSGNPTSFYDGYRYTMEWTEGRKLASVTYNNKETAFEYNHEGLRIKKTLSDDSYILYEIVDGVYVGETRYNANGSVSVYIRYILDEANNPVGISLWYPGDGRWTDYHFVKNLQGDVLKVYKVSDGSLAASYTYDSWGNILSQSGSLASINPFRYRSYYYDTETWFYYLHSRYYDPAIGRFINADSIASTGQGILGHNMFAYCNNNPVIFADPSGDFGILTGLAVAGIAVSSIIGGIVAGIGTATSGGSVGEIIASTVIEACTAGGIATVAAVGATLGATAGTVALTSAAIGAAGEIISLSVEHGFHKDDTDYSFNLVSAITRTIYAAGVSALGGAASYGLNMIYPGTEEIIGFGISAETALSLGLVDYSSRQIITSISTSP